MPTRVTSHWKSTRCAQKHHRRARTRRLRGLIRSVPAVARAAGDAQNGKGLPNDPVQAIFTLGATALGECRLKRHFEKVMLYAGYLFCVFISLINKRSKLLSYLSIAPILIATSIRENVGRDYPVYQDIFQGGTPVSGIDPVFLFLAHQLSELDGTGTLGFAVTAALIFLGYVLFINRFSYDIGLSLVIFLSIPVYYISSLNTLRIYVAIGICLGIASFLNKNSVLRLGLALAAIATHAATVLLLPFVLLKVWLSKRRFVLWLSFIVSPIIFANIVWIEQSLLPSSLSYYLDQESDDSRALIMVYASLTLLISFLNYVRKPTTENRYLYLIGIIYFTLCSIWMISSLGNIFLRIANLFAFFPILSIPIFLKQFFPNLYFREITRLIAFTLLSLYFSFKYFADNSFGYIG